MNTTTTLAPTTRAERTARRLATAGTLAVAILFVGARIAYADPTPGPGGPFVPITPDPNAPGVSGLKKLASIFATYVLWGSVICFFGSLAAMGLGKGIGEHRIVQGGKIGLLISVLVAFLLGIATVVLNTAYNAGA